jgi:hypothetical protein
MSANCEKFWNEISGQYVIPQTAFCCQVVAYKPPVSSDQLWLKTFSY